MDFDQPQRFLASIQRAGFFGPSYLDKLQETMRALIKVQELHLGAAQQIIRAAESTRRALAPHTLLAEDISRISEGFAARDAVLARMSPIADFVERQSAMWRDIREPALQIAEQMKSVLKQSRLSWDCGITQAIRQFRDMGVVPQRALLSVRLLEPFRTFTSFAQETRGFALGAHTSQLPALQASVRLAEAQLLNVPEQLSGMQPIPADEDPVPEPRCLALPFIQRRELLERAADVRSDEYEDLESLPPAAAEAKMAREILALATSCNEHAKVKGQPEIFKPTTRVLAVYADMPWILPEDRSTCREFVDCLYFLLYEGAGKDNLRFLKENGGVLEENECNLIWSIKHLRNKWLCHDPDHGKESDIKKSWGQLGAVLEDMGLHSLPTTPCDFRVLHRALLSRTQQFLRTIAQRLAAGGTSCSPMR